MIKIIFPLPDMALSPNRKNGKAWQSTQGKKEISRAIGEINTKAQHPFLTLDRRKDYCLSLVFYRKTKHHADLDNLLSSAKYIIDGMSRALNIDDKQFIYCNIEKNQDNTNPRLEIEITEFKSKL